MLFNAFGVFENFHGLGPKKGAFKCVHLAKPLISLHRCAGWLKVLLGVVVIAKDSLFMPVWLCWASLCLAYISWDTFQHAQGSSVMEWSYVVWIYKYKSMIRCGYGNHGQILWNKLSFCFRQNWFHRWFFKLLLRTRILDFMH